MTPQERGRLGGQATVAKYGSGHMSQIGRQGFQGLVIKLGDNGAAVSFLQKHRGMASFSRSQWAADSCYHISKDAGRVKLSPAVNVTAQYVTYVGKEA